MAWKKGPGAVLFTIAKGWMWLPNYVSNEWISQMKYYSALENVEKFVACYNVNMP